MSLLQYRRQHKPASPSEVPTDITRLDPLFQRRWAKLSLSGKTRARMYERLARPIASGGMRYEDALANLYKRVAFRQPDDTVAIVLRTVLYHLNSGDDLDQGLAYFIPLNELLLIQAGAANGNVAKGLFDAANSIKRNRAIVAVSLRATTFPVLILFAVLGCLYVMGAMLVPEFERGMPREEWTGVGVILRYLGNFTAANGFVYLGVLCLALVVLVVFSLKRWAGAGRSVADHFPPYSLYKTFTGSAWLLVLSSMSSSGEPVWKSLATIHQVAVNQGNRYVAARTHAVIKSNAKGHDSVANAMEDAGNGFPDHELIADLVLMAGNKDFNKQMSEITNDWIADRVETVKNTAFLLEILLLILSAILLGAFMFAFFDVQQQFTQSVGM
nr:type II secretion system F family protein [uncultured Halomonas sp.]